MEERYMEEKDMEKKDMAEKPRGPAGARRYSLTKEEENNEKGTDGKRWVLIVLLAIFLLGE